MSKQRSLTFLIFFSGEASIVGHEFLSNHHETKILIGVSVQVICSFGRAFRLELGNDISNLWYSKHD